MTPERPAVTRLLVSGVAAIMVPMLHLLNRRGVAKVSLMVGRAALLPVPLSRFAEDGLGTRVVGHVRATSARLGLGHTSCIARAQLAFIILSWAGYAPVVKTGAQALVGRGGDAHAWVEIEGVPVGENVTELASYQNLVTVLLP